MNIEQAKRIPIREYLAKLGHHPVKQRRSEFVYFSPFRSEKTPSFMVRENGGRDRECIFFDHAEAIGGSIIELMKKLFPGYTVSDILKELSNNTYTYKVPEKLERIKQENPIRIRNTKPLKQQGLIKYLESRSICIELANHYLVEVWYEIGNKVYFAIGWKTDSGYEMRSKIGDYDFKGCTGSKGITVIDGSNENVFIFESMLDYLSYLQLSPKKITKLSGKTIILNSTSLVNRILDKLDEAKNIYTYLDNDPAGKKCEAKIEEKYKITRQTFFHPSKDVNEFIMEQGL